MEDIKQKCRNCKLEKNASEFAKCAKSKTKLQYNCKKCCVNIIMSNAKLIDCECGKSYYTYNSSAHKHTSHHKSYIEINNLKNEINQLKSLSQIKV
jgi:tRNA(Ile2) C34 agmatinyltransferase TiaS